MLLRNLDPKKKSYEERSNKGWGEMMFQGTGRGVEGNRP